MKFLKHQYYKLLILLNYMQVFGLQCFSVYRRFHGKSNEAVIEADLQKTYGRCVYLRPGTSDIHSLEQVLVNRDYRLKMNYPVNTIIDAGANAGYASVFFARHYPDARIIALEPEESNLEMIRMNMKNTSGFFLEPCALWKTKAQLHLMDGLTSKWSFRFTEDSPGKKYDAVDMRSLFEKYSIDRLDLCKIDIEGGEKEVFAAPDADWWLQKTNVLFVELHERFEPGTEKVFFETMKRNSFTCRISGENILAINPKLIS